MNARIIVYLLIGAFVLPGCARFKEKLIEAKKAQYAKIDPDKAEREKFFAECDAFIEQCEAERKEFEKHIKEFGEIQSEYNAWYDSLPTDKQAYITRELEEKQIRYNQIYGFNEDGSSHYVSSGTYFSDRLRLMHHYKPIWDNLH